MSIGMFILFLLSIVVAIAGISWHGYKCFAKKEAATLFFNQTPLSACIAVLTTFTSVQLWKKYPIPAISFCIFHCGQLFLVPFLFAHAILLEQGVGISLPMFSEYISTLLAFVWFISAVVFAISFITIAELRNHMEFKKICAFIIALLPSSSGLLLHYDMVHMRWGLLLHQLFVVCFFISLVIPACSYLRLLFDRKIS